MHGKIALCCMNMQAWIDASGYQCFLSDIVQNINLVACLSVPVGHMCQRKSLFLLVPNPNIFHI